MILPDLAKRIAWYQERLRPQDNAFGNGIADWTITSEYADDLRVGDAPVYGCMGSPSTGGMSRLTSEDIAAKRAHIVVRTPKTAADLPEVDRTILHELGHVLVAPMQSADRAAEENAMHSLDHFFSKLSPEEGQALARALQNPMARAYRVEDGAVTELTEDKDKAPGPAKLEGDMGVDEIKAALVKAVLDGQPTDELAKKLVAAMATAGASDAPVAPIAPPEMGMKPEEAYARGKKAAEAEAEAKAVKAFAGTIEGLSEDQRAMVRKMPTLDDAQALVKTYARPTTGAGAKMGLEENPKARGAATVRARALQADEDVMARVRRASSSEDTAGLHLDVPGHILAWSPTEWLKEQYGAFKKAQNGVVQ